MKFSGTVGFWFGEKEVSPGIWKPLIEEKSYHGNFLRQNLRFQTSSEKKNDDISISSKISILSDIYLRDHLGAVRYIFWKGAKWKVLSIEPSYPRIVFEIGGIWNGSKKEGETS